MLIYFGLTGRLAVLKHIYLQNILQNYWISYYIKSFILKKEHGKYSNRNKNAVTGVLRRVS